MYARQIAWLHTIPEKQKRSRAETLKNNPRYTDPPDLFGCEYLLDLAHEIGLEAAGYPVTYREILAWCKLSGMYLSAWEVTVLREMSRAFCDQKARSVRPDCPPPMYQEKRSTNDMRQDVDKAVREMFQRRAARNKGLKKR